MATEHTVPTRSTVHTTSRRKGKSFSSFELVAFGLIAKQKYKDKLILKWDCLLLLKMLSLPTLIGLIGGSFERFLAHSARVIAAGGCRMWKFPSVFMGIVLASCAASAQDLACVLIRDSTVVNSTVKVQAVNQCPAAILVVQLTLRSAELERDVGVLVDYTGSEGHPMVPAGHPDFGFWRMNLERKILISTGKPVRDYDVAASAIVLEDGRIVGPTDRLAVVFRRWQVTLDEITEASKALAIFRNRGSSSTAFAAPDWQELSRARVNMRPKADSEGRSQVSMFYKTLNTMTGVVRELVANGAKTQREGNELLERMIQREMETLQGLVARFGGVQ